MDGMERAQRTYDMQSDDRDEEEERPIEEPPEDIDQAERAFAAIRKAQ